jgi:sulfur carrier protein
MIEITLNGERRTLSRPLSVCELIDHIGRDPRKVAVEINCEIVPNMHHAERHLRAGDAVEVVTLVGDGEHPPADKPLKIGNFTFLAFPLRRLGNEPSGHADVVSHHGWLREAAGTLADRT